MHPLSARVVCAWSEKYEHRAQRKEDVKDERKNGMRVASVARKIEYNVLCVRARSTNTTLLALGMTRSEETAKIYYAALRRCHPRPARMGATCPDPPPPAPGPAAFYFLFPATRRGTVNVDIRVEIPKF